MQIFKIWPKRLYILTFILAIISSFDGAISGALIKYLTEFIEQGLTGGIYRLIIIFLMIYLVMVIANYFYNVMVNRFVKDFNVAIKDKIISNYLLNDKDYSFNKEAETLSLLFNDVKLFEENFTSIYFNVYRYIFWALMSLLFALFIDWKLALLFVAFSVLPAIWPFIFKRPLMNRTNSWSKEVSVYTECAQETVHNRETINEFNQRLLFDNRHDQQNRKVEDHLFKLHNLQAASVAAVGMTSIICFIMPLCIGGIMVGQGLATLPNLLAVFIASDQIIKPLEVAFQMYNQLNTAEPIKDKFNEILKTTPQETVQEEFNGISLEDVCIKLDGFELLKDVNLSISYGDKVFVTGESGSGKTILTKCIEGYIDPNKGKRQLTCDLNKPFIDEMIYTSQDNVIFSGTYNFNVLFDDKKAPARELSNVLGLEDLADDNTFITPNSISGGQSKRINLARALSVSGRKLLLLDEPFQGLSSSQASEIEEDILSNNDFVVVVSHVISTNNLDKYNKFIYVGNHSIKVFSSASEFNDYRNLQV